MGIGDELMAAGEARRHHALTGRPVKIVRQSVRIRWYDVWDNVPYILREEDRGKHDVLYAKDKEGLRPYIAGKTDTQWTWRRYSALPADINLSIGERTFARDALGRSDGILVEPNLKPAAPRNKDWGWDRWQKLIASRPELPWLQVGPSGARILKGVRHIETKNFRAAAAVLAACRAAVLSEGALHHAAAALKTRSIVIFGGYISPQVTGYQEQTSLFAPSEKWPLGCGMRVPCTHCAAAMQSITPARVLQELEDLLAELPRPVPA